MNYKNLFLSTLTISVLFGSVPKNSLATSEVIFPEDNNDAISYQENSKLGNQFNYKEAISHEILNSTIRSTFVPKNSQQENIDLTRLAYSLGYDHFNWVSYVEVDPHGIADQSGKQLKAPYNDPPMGGYQYDIADHLPFYWDMEHCDGCKFRYNFQHPQNLRQSSLTFLDSPSDHRLQPGESIKFITSLVGVTKYDLQGNKAEWEVLHTFSWELKNIRPLDNRVYLINPDIQVEQISPTLIQAMQLDGAVSLPKLQLSNFP